MFMAAEVGVEPTTNQDRIKKYLLLHFHFLNLWVNTLMIKSFFDAILLK